jgi:hypothetical protein
MRMPITVAARFENGSEQRALTERLADVDELRFEANSPLTSVVIEPDAAVALAEVKRQLVCKRSTIGRAGESSNGTPWSAKRRLSSDRSRSHLQSLPWLEFAV